MPNFVPSIPNLVSNEENECLISTVVTSDEIENAVKQMASDKAPGLDGFQPLFFKNLWPIAKSYILDATKDFFRTCSMTLEKHIHKNLIPK